MKRKFGKSEIGSALCAINRHILDANHLYKCTEDTDVWELTFMLDCCKKDLEKLLEIMDKVNSKS